ncbi:hypothetical protein AgCh_008811 [Apium graveolens]
MRGRLRVTGDPSSDVNDGKEIPDYGGTRIVASVRGDELNEELEFLKGIDATMLFHDLPCTEEKVGRVKAAMGDDLDICAAVDAGSLLVDGLGDGILLEAPDQDFDFIGNTSFNLLQGCRMRNTKIVEIAIIGCIVNGTGEMADAYFGYVGGAPGKIDLYVGKVKMNTSPWTLDME